MRIPILLALGGVGLLLCACGHNLEQRAATGAVGGAVIGGPVGAVVGATAGVVIDKSDKPKP
jgi:hypothetical protein